MIEVTGVKYVQAQDALTKALRRLPPDLREAYASRRGWVVFIPYRTWDYTRDVAMVGEEEAHRIELLLGPHANTIVHMWVLRNLP